LTSQISHHPFKSEAYTENALVSGNMLGIYMAIQGKYLYDDLVGDLSTKQNNNETNWWEMQHQKKTFAI